MLLVLKRQYYLEGLLSFSVPQKMHRKCDKFFPNEQIKRQEKGIKLKLEKPSKYRVENTDEKEKKRGKREKEKETETGDRSKGRSSQSEQACDKLRSAASRSRNGKSQQTETLCLRVSSFMVLV